VLELPLHPPATVVPNPSPIETVVSRKKKLPYYKGCMIKLMEYLISEKNVTNNHFLSLVCY